ncbi:MAG: hypothetical protein WCG47_14420 [Dermatophilaceae bacterium]
MGTSLPTSMSALTAGCLSYRRRHRADVVTGLLPFIGYPRTLNALAAIDEIAPATSA